MGSLANKYTGLALSAFEIKELTGWPDALVDDYVSLLTSLQTLSQELQTSINTANANYTLTGTGSPEGAVTANKSLMYIDTAGPTLYVNPTEGANTGWVTA